MRVNQKTIISAGMLFFLLLVSYRFSLLNEVPPPFGGFMTYVLMTIGIIPTILILIFTSFLCQATCFGSPFAFSDSSGFMLYIIASIITVLALIKLVTRVQK
jgi:hypothetical protein